MSLLAAPSARPLLAATCYRALPISTATANRITCFTAAAHVKRRSGISATTFSSAARGGQLFRLAGPWSHHENRHFNACCRCQRPGEVFLTCDNRQDRKSVV